MLGAQNRALRSASQSWVADPLSCRRFLSGGGGGGGSGDRAPSHRQTPLTHRRYPTSTRDGQTIRSNANGRRRHPPQPPRQPSLIELLFPEETLRYEAQQRAASEAREVPRLPVDTTPVTPRQQNQPHPEEDATRSKRDRRLEARLRESGPVSSVLVLRNASPNLTEDDFRRLIPQGRHIEGWTLEQGDIVRVVPGRDLATLAHDGSYYLIFSSPLNAFTYQRHVTRIHVLTVRHAPSGLDSPFAPAPGKVIDGVDVHAAMSAYTLVPPTQQLELRQLKPPLSPVVDAIVRHGGYPSLVTRADRMPFEARLTLEGPQLHASRVRYILMESGRARGLGWSGGEGLNLRVTRWEPVAIPSAMGSPASPFARVLERTEGEQAARDYARLAAGRGVDAYDDDDGTGGKQPRRRVPNAVYIVGFHTERAAQMFVQTWNRRPMVMPGEEAEDLAEGDAPPIANVEMLW